MAKRRLPDRILPPVDVLEPRREVEDDEPDEATEVEYEGTAEDDAEDDDELIATALKRFQLVVDAEDAQRKQELEDLKFARARREDQWDPESLRLRSGVTIGSVTSPAKPCLVIDKIGPALRQILNEAAQARLSLQIKAKASGATSDGAEMRQGMIRSIEADSNAQFARMWALRRAAICGRGYYRIGTDYANDGDFDLDLRIESIVNQGSVYLDPHHTDPSGADAEWAFLTDDLSHEEYKRRYPKSEVAMSISSEFQSLTDTPPGWITDEHVRIAEYWRVEHKERTLVYDPRLPVESQNKVFADEIEALVPGWTKSPATKTRKVDVRTVYRHTINGMEVLKTEQWDGRFIPIVQVIGEMNVVDGDRAYKGIVTPAKDPQRSLNYFRSEQVSRAALGGAAPYLVDPDKHFRPGYKTIWDKSAGKMLPYLPVAFVDENNQPIQQPTRNFSEPELDGITLAVREAAEDIKAATGRQDPSLGKMSGERSGKAIQALKAAGETSSSHFLENLATISMPHEGRILLDMLGKVYDRPGRIVRVLGEDEGDESNVMLGVPFVQGPDGQPIQVTPQMQMGMPPGGMPPPAMPPQGVPPGMPGQPMPQPGMPPQKAPKPPKVYDLSKGEYQVTVSVGRSFATQREANLEAMSSWVEASGGAAFPWLADIMAEQLDGQMGVRVSKRMKMMNPQLAQDQEGAEDVPPAAQAQIQQLTMQTQQMQQQLQAAAMEKQADTAKSQADLARTKMETESRERIAKAQIDAEMAKTKLLMTSKEGLAILEMQESRLDRVLNTERDLADRDDERRFETEREERTRRDKDADHRRKVETMDRQAVGKAALSKFQSGIDEERAAIAAEREAAAAQPVTGFTPPANDVPVGPSGTASDPRGI